MDEFHYHSNHSRGAAWQIPLLTLPRARFLLMSATLGDSSFFSKQLAALTGAPTTQLQEKVAELNELGRSSVYLVHFTQNACADTARDLLSTNFRTKEEKTRHHPPSCTLRVPTLGRAVVRGGRCLCWRAVRVWAGTYPAAHEDL